MDDQRYLRDAVHSIVKSLAKHRKDSTPPSPGAEVILLCDPARRYR